MYEPQVNDYVYWKPHIKGWVYFKDNDYVTIECFVEPKNQENYEACSLHRNDRLLIVCYRNQWSELKYVKSRKSVHEESLETVGKGTGAKGIQE